jgi:diguanylate cyclase (GGDEF)-like protein/PAS domain S-box-containing protein
MFGLRSVQGRATAAILVLLVLLGSVAAVAAWRAQKERAVHQSLEVRSNVVAAVEKARAEFLRGATLITAAIFAEDATPFVDSYRQANAERDEQLFRARVALTALGDTDALAALDSCIERLEQTKAKIEAIVNFAATADVSTRIGVAQQQYATLWAETQAQLAELDELANGQEAALVAERAAADSTAEATLALMLGLSALAFLVGAATLSGLLMSVVRPLAALRTSARAVASGNLEARAKVAGPEEVASLARDFNEMVDQRRRVEEALRGQSRDLGERAKELNCLYGISNLLQRPDISLEEILQGTVNLIPPAWQYPEITCARIVLGGQEYLTESFRETAWRQTNDIIVNGERTGAVEVCYLEERPESDEGPFLTEERGLINAIAERLGRVSERKQVEETLRESEARYKALFAGAPEGMLVADLQTKQFRHVNPAMCRMFGYTEEEFLRIGVADIHPKESLSYVLAEFEAQARGEKRSSSDIPCQRKDGSLFYANINAIMVALDGRRCNLGFFTDVTERKKAEAALRESEERYRSIFESIQDVFYRTDAEGIITEISPSIERFGYTREALMGTQVLGVYEDPEERSGLLKALLEQGDVADHEIRLKTGDGRLINTSVSAHILRGPDGTPSGVEGTLRDISDRKAAEQALRESEEALHEQARRDPLTGVLNHGAIVDEMRSLISTGEHGSRCAVAMIDVDGLKVTNDTYGHQVGDAVLVAVAAVLSRDDALVGRYGGDEFVAILPGADRNAAERYRKDATDALAHATITDPQTGANIRAEASIGLAIYPEDGSTLANLIKISDDAMYAVKRQRHDRRRSPRKHAPDRKAA